MASARRQADTLAVKAREGGWSQDWAGTTLGETDPATGQVPEKVVYNQAGRATEQRGLKLDCTRHLSLRPTESSNMEPHTPEKVILKTWAD